MKIFAISDLHLGARVEKPMDVFGPEWTDHAARIARNWRETVEEDDLVLMPGDLSWAMTLEDAVEDLEFIRSLPGRKFFIRGNHDYWFSGPEKVRAMLGEGLDFIRFDARVCGGVGICGVRGWSWPGYGEYDKERDERHCSREKHRLRLSLDELARLKWETACAMIHYPPITPFARSGFCSMLHGAGVSRVVYGHLHGEARAEAFEGEVEGVHYTCVSADHTGFRPKFLFETH